MKSELQAKRQLLSVLTLLGRRLELEIAVLRHEDARLSVSEIEYLSQLSDVAWAGLRNAQLVGNRLRGIVRQRQSLAVVMDRSATKLMRHRMAEEKLAEQIEELEEAVTSLQMEMDANESVGNATAAFSLTQDF